MILLSALAWLTAGSLAILLIVLTIETLAGLLPARAVSSDRKMARTAILIPAHDEEQGIGATLQALHAVAPPSTRVVVVADNCLDRTAQVARASGAETVARTCPERRGKGYALAFGRDHLSRDPPEVVIVLDADCRLAAGSVERLAGVVLKTGAPAQAVNLLDPDPEASSLVQISGFAFLVKNLVRSRGMTRLGGAALLTGTGMAFPWTIFANADLATGNLAEDLDLGIDLTRAGAIPRLVADARVSSPPAHRSDTLEQRARWERGFLTTAQNRALPLLVHAITRGSRASALLGLHLLVPPLALLFAISGLGLLALIGWSEFAAQWGPALLLGSGLALAAAAVGLAWLLEGRATLSGKTLLLAPAYVLWKLPFYLRLAGSRDLSWQRARRRP